MEKLVIRGGNRLTGPLAVSNSKNTALPLMAATLIAEGISTVRGIPRLRDIATFSHVLRFCGAHVSHDGLNMTVDASEIRFPEAPYALVKRMRASFYMLGALLGRCGRARVSLPGGCAWGPRPVDLHIRGMEALGADVGLDQGYVVARARGGRLAGGNFNLAPCSVGATVNFLLAAVTARGGSRITNAAIEPDVVVFCEMLRAMGARIHGVGTRSVEIEGVDQLSAVSFSNCPDRIELGTFMILAAMAGEQGSVTRITNAHPNHLGTEFVTAFRSTGAGCTLGPNYVDIETPERIQPVSITTQIYPGFPTDLQAQWTVMLTQADGPSSVIDQVYADRFKHIPELQRLGAKIRVRGNSAIIHGRSPLQGANVMCTDLRAGVSLVLAGLVAEGSTHVRRIYHLDRGYERLEGKLAAAGLDVHREWYDEFKEPTAPG